MFGKIVRFIFGAVWNRVLLWWANRKLAEAESKAEVAARKLESVQAGKAEEVKVTEVAEKVVAAAEKVDPTVDAMLAEMQNRAENRAK